MQLKDSFDKDGKKISPSLPKHIKNYLIESGLTAEIIDDLDGDSMIELLEIINGTKKN